MTTTPTIGGDPGDLLAAVQELTRSVADLADHLSVSQDQAARVEKQAKRTRWLTWVVLGLVLLSLSGVTFTAVVLDKVSEAVDDSQANAVISCQNANEARIANKILWDFLIDASLAQDSQSPESRALLVELKDFITALYAQRDCSDLSKKYVLPSPPAITNLGKPPSEPPSQIPSPS